MSLLTETTKAATTTPSRWAGKVHTGAVVAPWWNTSSTVGVVECTVADVLRLLVHVNRGKNGRLYANPPSAKRGDSWVAQYEITDSDLAKTVQAVAVQAAETFLATAPAQPDADAGDMPF